MHKDLLLEIGLEEVPARYLPNASTQLVEKIQQFLEHKRIPFKAITPYYTPRRLAVIVTQLAEKQEDLNENARGPAKRIALDDEGNWSKAALGFARGQGVSPEDLFMDEFKGEQYVFAKKFQAGLATSQLLQELPAIIKSMNFPKNMRWGTQELRFIRPIRWLVALFGDEVIPFTIAGIESNRVTRGHRFLGKEVSLNNVGEYVSSLANEYALVEREVREGRIVEQIKAISEEKGWIIDLDEELLNEVTNLVEYPTALYGSFDESFLHIPREVLVTAMKTHQRYFPVEDQEGQLLPYFITVRNGDDRNLTGVARGNEKVLSARLADARFFYEEDQRLPIDEANERLNNIVFHEELGSIGDKVRRIRELAGEWAELLKLEEQVVEHIDRTSTICKFDLVTQMVNEFPELQGTMGMDYALKAGESTAVAEGIFEHYLPRFSGDQIPSSDVGALVSLADKLDTLVGIFSLGMVPTGSQDPYALRRQAQGIVQILLERDYEFTLEQLFNSSVKTLKQHQLLKRDEDELHNDFNQFFILRLRNLLSERGLRYDVVDSLLGRPVGRIADLVAKGEVIQGEIEQSEFKKTVEAFTRVNNLASKAEDAELDPTQLVAEAEKELYEYFIEVKQKAENYLKERQFTSALKSMATLQPYIESFFDSVMVMVEDEQLRNARLALLKQLSNLFGQFTDFNKLVFPA